MNNHLNQESGKSGFRFFKGERLRSKIFIEKVFAEGHPFLVYPFKVVYLDIDLPGRFPVQVAFAVSKKLFKKAVHRNLIKRRMREAYRLHRQQLIPDLPVSKKAFVCIYIGKEIVPFRQIEKAMIRTLSLLAQNP